MVPTGCGQDGAVGLQSPSVVVEADLSVAGHILEESVEGARESGLELLPKRAGRRLQVRRSARQSGSRPEGLDWSVRAQKASLVCCHCGSGRKNDSNRPKFFAPSNGEVAGADLVAHLEKLALSQRRRSIAPLRQMSDSSALGAKSTGVSGVRRGVTPLKRARRSATPIPDRPRLAVLRDEPCALRPRQPRHLHYEPTP